MERCLGTPPCSMPALWLEGHWATAANRGAFECDMMRKYSKSIYLQLMVQQLWGLLSLCVTWKSLIACLPISTSLVTKSMASAMLNKQLPGSSSIHKRQNSLICRIFKGDQAPACMHFFVQGFWYPYFVNRPFSPFLSMIRLWNDASLVSLGAMLIDQQTWHFPVDLWVSSKASRPLVCIRCQ